MTGRDHYSDAAIVIGLRVLSLQRGRETSARGLVPLTRVWWDEHRDPAVHPPAETVARRFGGWRRACEAAGVPVRTASRTHGRAPTWTDEEVLAQLRLFLAGAYRHGRTFAAYDAWSRERPWRPSGATVLRRFRSFGRACGRALAP